MSWQDDPVVSSSGSDWKNDPVVDTPSVPESFGHGAVNNFPFGGQLAAGVKSISNDKGYSQNLEDWNVQTPIDKEAHPVAYGTGAVAGAVAPLLIPGVGEALKAAPIAGNAALGAANALGNTNLTKDPKEIAKEGIEGLAVGAGMGKAGELVGQGANALKENLTPAAKRISANAIAGAIDLNSHAIKRLAPGMTNPEDLMDVVEGKIEKLFPKLVGWTDTAGSKLDKLIVGHNQASDAIGKVVDETTQKTGGVLPEVNDAIDKLTAEAKKFNNRTSSENAEAKNILTDKVLDLQDLQKSGQLNFQNLYEIKKGIGESFHNPATVNKGNKIAYGIISDTIDDILNRAHVDLAYKKAFDHEKEVFKFTSDLIPAMKPGVAREVAGVGGGILSAGLGTAAAMGHMAAIPAYIAKTATKLAAPDLGQNAAYKMVRAAKNFKPGALMKNTPQAINQAVRNYLISKFKDKND